MYCYHIAINEKLRSKQGKERDNGERSNQINEEIKTWFAKRMKFGDENRRLDHSTGLDQGSTINRPKGLVRDKVYRSVDKT